MEYHFKCNIEHSILSQLPHVEVKNYENRQKFYTPVIRHLKVKDCLKFWQKYFSKINACIRVWRLWTDTIANPKKNWKSFALSVIDKALLTRVKITLKRQLNSKLNRSLINPSICLSNFRMLQNQTHCSPRMRHMNMCKSWENILLLCSKKCTKVWLIVFIISRSDKW